jgi:uncharacterized protein YlzI (FlbEa/FlbD family)
MTRIFFQITVTYSDTSTQIIFINVNLIEYISETTSGVHIKMQNGNSWIVNESIYTLLERLQS